MVGGAYHPVEPNCILSAMVVFWATAAVLRIDELPRPLMVWSCSKRVLDKLSS